MTLRLNGSTSGYVEIDAPAVAGTTSITIPATSGEAIVKAANGSVDLGSVDIDSSGRLLVGTSTSVNTGTTVGANLEVFGSVGSVNIRRGSNNSSPAILALGKSRSATDGSYLIVNNGDILGTLRFAGDDGTDLQTLAAEIKAEVDGTPGANDMPGRLVFSTTSTGASSPTERMRILNFGLTRLYSDESCWTWRSAAASGTTYLFVEARHSATGIESGGTVSFRVFTNGNVQNTNNSYSAISDIKLKENIVDASSQWNDIKALRPVNYNFKEETGAETYKQIGLIAQEVELVSPGLVSESPDRDADGNDLGTVTKSVNYSVLYMKAVKALQEAMERIEALETRLTALEGGTAQ